ncbi:MAG: transcription-repair coupling factor [Gammaproteobacteria bacterium]
MMTTLRRPDLPETGASPVRWGGLVGDSDALAIAEAAARHAGPVLCITASAREADRLEAAIRFFAGAGTPVLHFPDWETLPYDSFSPHQDIISERLATLAGLPGLQRGIVVVAAPCLMQRLPPTDYVGTRSLSLRVGETLDRDAFIRRLESGGYLRVPEVSEHGEFAVRGAIIDLYPMGANEPYRIDLFDDEIETLRAFDPETQISGETLESVRILPAREAPLDEDAIRAFRRRYRARFAGEAARSPLYRDVSDGIAHGGIEYYLPLFFDETSTLLDYLPVSTLLAVGDDFDDTLDAFWAEIEERHALVSLDPERPVLDPPEAFVTADALRAGLESRPRIVLSGNRPLPDEGEDFGTRPVPVLRLDSRREEATGALTGFLDDFEGRVLFTAESPGRREALSDLLSDLGHAAARTAGWEAFATGEARIALSLGPLETGVVLPDAGVAIVTEQSLFGERARQASRRRRASRDPENIIRQLSDLREGAPVVHEEYGVGRYLGLTTLEVGDVPAEFLTLEYADGDKLYVPVHSLHLISRYTGASPEHAPLHRLGSDQWEKARRRAAEKVRDVAAELLDVYARRAARPGHAFRLDEHDYRAFEADFPFEPTEDQQRVIEEVLADMRTASSMDRVVCGDVGFGKTEVALRAAFVAVQAGKQVALLVPTTLLAQQHYQSFTDRFADWPVRIEVLSRFRSRKDTDAVLADISAGKVDIVIATHKLLQHTSIFRDLGLVIVDEEHRFGVRHKEALKSLRADVDVLTLTATPIPRTLNMALGGLRELSLITTPPSERLAVKTFVSQWNDAMVREACLREIKRGGQVYFVHNRVEDIERVRQRIADLVPEADIRVGHGQMPERELEQVMIDFYHRRFNVLLCTTIIESGIDVPTANTIIINRADRFGLAQLHQLRGRVGRSHHRAYAYLIAPPKAAMTADAAKRLEAIDSLEDLGAGFALASHDLEIRGAGELLGDEQSGQIQEVGFALYTEMLQRAVESLRRGEEPDFDKPLHGGVEINLHCAALLPEDYVPDVHLRLVLYKRVAGTRTRDELKELQVELIDRFGLLPLPARRLLEIAELKLAAEPLGIRKIDVGPQGGWLQFGPDPAVEPLTLIELIQERDSVYRLKNDDRLTFRLTLPEIEDRLAHLARLIERLGAGADRRAMAS